ncbi:ComEC/Rec2 family competence protein [Methyloversatilis thermotolerans]|uniref:ComEC/Rec2 family competence protein n=1 Tax=Methyloversatilis thermotolerans TaxID=1346290 RepID=UPI00037C7EF1|nr:ComEC/Rec2 family competence protein [Methyloversatilis thermotolerans]
MSPLSVLALAMLCGCFAASRMPALPQPALLLAAASCACLAALALARWTPSLRPLATFAALVVCAWAGALYWGHLHVADRVQPALEGVDVDVTGIVSSLPLRIERGLRFEFDVEAGPVGVPRRIALNWYDGARGEHGQPGSSEAFSRPPVPAGSRWQLRVRLKRPHGNMNPHGFDYEGWLFARGIGATGHVRATGADRAAQRMLQREADGWGPAVQRLRERVRERFERVLAEDDAALPWAGVLVALAIGEQRAISPAQWDLFERAGLTHLVSISGLHVTMVAALVAALIGAGWRRLPALALRCAAQRAGLIAGLVAATGYCVLAGFGIPAQRTLVMLAVGVLMLWSGRGAAVVDALALALCAVLVLHPLAVIDAGFWLSFGAVALLFHAASGEAGEGQALHAWLRAQAAITLGLAPLTLALFGRVSLLAPLANLLAIPVISLLVTPLVLTAIVLPLDLLLYAAHALTSGLMAVMSWLTAPDWSLWHSPAPSALAVACGLIGAVCALAPPGWPGRVLALPLMLPLLWPPVDRPQPGDMRVTVLDVGQGLAVHVQGARTDLLFDTGPRYGAEADAGERLVLPYLRAMGVSALDVMMVSHADSDHAGGAASLLAGLPVRRLLSSVPPGDVLRLARPDGETCAAGQRWQADGLTFSVLHPPPGAVERGGQSSNALSCVLRVDSAHGSVLITGDLLAQGETSLVDAGAALASDVLVSPHHGSRTSSSPAFVSAVAAREVVHTAGYRNRFGHPHPAVVARYAGAGALQRRSDRDGAVRYLFRRDGLVIESSRERDRRYWHHF